MNLGRRSSRSFGPRVIAIAVMLAFLHGSAANAEDGYGDDCLEPQDTALLPDQPFLQMQPSETQDADQGQAVRPPEQSPQNKSNRMFFVMPNFLSVDNETQVMPLTWRGKFAITAKGAFDPYEFAIVGVLAGIRQAENAFPPFGQGFKGYAKRYGTALTDQIDGNMMVGAVFPAILKTDPRYFELGKGHFVRRFGYAISRIFVTLKDAGGHTVNVSEFAGNGVAIAISNLYYPAANRGVATGLNNWATQMSIDALGNELKEFWPDIHRHLLPKKKQRDPQSQ